MSVFGMDYKDAILREDAMEWLLRNYYRFPDDIAPGKSMSVNVSDVIFADWRWVRTLDGEILFANCIQPGISADEFNERLKEATY